MTEADCGAGGRAVRVCGLAEAQAAAQAARDQGHPLLLVSVAGAGGSAGAGWWRALSDRLAGEFPGLAITAVLDCGDAAGDALAALRAGVRDFAFTGPVAVAARLEAMAEATGARLWRSLPPALDLRHHRHPAAALAQWLDPTG